MLPLSLQRMDERILRSLVSFSSHFASETRPWNAQWPPHADFLQVYSRGGSEWLELIVASVHQLSARLHAWLDVMICRHVCQRCRRTSLPPTAQQDEAARSGTNTTAGCLPSPKSAGDTSTSPSGHQYAVHGFPDQARATHAKGRSVLLFMHCVPHPSDNIVVPRRKMRSRKGQPDRRWSLTAKTRRVPHNIEPLSPSGRLG